MPNGFNKQPTANVSSISSGSSVIFTLFYEYTPVIDGEAKPEVSIDCSPAFSIVKTDPSPLALSPNMNGSVKVTVTIARRSPPPPTFCRVVFTALNDERECSVTVTP